MASLPLIVARRAARGLIFGDMMDWLAILDMAIRLHVASVTLGLLVAADWWAGAPYAMDCIDARQR